MCRTTVSSCGNNGFGLSTERDELFVLIYGVACSSEGGKPVRAREYWNVGEFHNGRHNSVRIVGDTEGMCKPRRKQE